MYIRITSRCNMTCAHCCYGCTAEGEDMTMDVFRAAIELEPESISIGGGEPTIHPLFWQMLGESIGAAGEYVWLATNGSQTRTALALAAMAHKGVIGCALSRDDYHDEIDEEVVDAFTVDTRRHSPFDNRTPDAREIRDVTGNEINGGRCDFGKADECACPGLLVDPDGTIRGCGCDDAPTFGTVFNPQIPDDWDWTECHKQQSEEG